MPTAKAKAKTKAPVKKTVAKASAKKVAKAPVKPAVKPKATAKAKAVSKSAAAVAAVKAKPVAKHVAHPVAPAHAKPAPPKNESVFARLLREKAERHAQFQKQNEHQHKSNEGHMPQNHASFSKFAGPRRRAS